MENPIDTPRLPRKRRSLAQELVTVLSEQIRDGLLKRGDKLPTESAIMEAHGVSRTVVREAISRLQAAGQVETRHGIGTFVLDTPSRAVFASTRRPSSPCVMCWRFSNCASASKSSLPALPHNAAAPSSWRPMRAALDALNESAAHASDAVASDFAVSTCKSPYPPATATSPTS